MLSAMIVDDTEFTRNELRDLDIWGEKSGFSISAEACNGRDALRALQKQPVDLVITDIRMPVVDGISLTKTLLDEKLCKCVILMSQFSDFEYARKGIQSGAFEYLLKPIERDALLATLQKASAYISERNNELQKINYVDQVLKTQDHYPYEQFKILVKSIKEDGDSAAVAADIFEVIWLKTDSDLMKSIYYLNRVLQDVAKAVCAEFPWAKKLARPTAAGSINFSSIRGSGDLKAAFIGHIRAIKAFILKYELRGGDNGIIKTVCRYVLENIDAPMSLGFLSRKLFVSSSYLSFLFKKKTGINLIEYITTVKLERSKVLLEEGVLKNYEIADMAGFSMEYYSKLFKKTYAVSPNQYRKIAAGKI
ncbi:two-component system, response regulator YesN [Sporobacter termitidis DSM 10068]|uniref:Stage 0 sporulation protein A homolog n=1 Tax=Sporobacter termitidis DSM 10068 TaxID=1123282 RepID=A0A1M5TTW6_9FIRM|nr:response regulator [Sporobacter termitidis]SHH54026.1 two-component system, response regulator YesN [Sporobacter termitidis DSM 10068]